MPDYKRLTNAPLVNAPCKINPDCEAIVSFGVSPMGGEPDEAIGSCGRHLPVAIRAVFDIHNTAVVVQEVPVFTRTKNTGSRNKRR